MLMCSNLLREMWVLYLPVDDRSKSSADSITSDVHNHEGLGLDYHDDQRCEKHERGIQVAMPQAFLIWHKAYQKSESKP